MQKTIANDTKLFIEKYDTEVSQWDPKPSDVNRRALLVIGFAVDK